jgi:excisionase family DNA binding protein
MADHEEHFESPDEVAERLLVDPQTVRRWIRSGKLRAYKPGRGYRILSSDLDEFLETRRFPKGPAPSEARPSEVVPITRYEIETALDRLLDSKEGEHDIGSVVEEFEAQLRRVAHERQGGAA